MTISSSAANTSSALAAILRADTQIIRVSEADARRRSGLDAHLVSRIHELRGQPRDEPDAIFVNLDFLRYTDAHGGPAASILSSRG